MKEKPTKGHATWSDKGKKQSPQIAEGKRKRMGGDDQQSEVEKENAAVDKDLMQSKQKRRTATSKKVPPMPNSHSFNDSDSEE